VPTDDPVVRILHLSDFHFRETTAWDAEPVLGRLAADIARLTGSGLAPDLIVITGDIVFSGKAKEYELAADWMRERLLPAAGAQPGQLFLVPGNHDVDRDLVDVVARHAAQGLLRESQQQDVAALLGGESGTVFLRRHRAFVEFVNRFGGSGAPQHQPWHALTREIRGIRVHFAGFSSTWLASGDDRGRLLLGLWQCNELLRGADDAEIVIAAMHHPWDYLAEWDHVSRAEIERSASLVLRGHLHDTRHTFTQSTHHGGVLELAAGACYENSRWPNSYHLIELFPRSGRARIHPRYWDAHRRDWQPDHNLFGKTAAEMPLRVRQPPQKRSPYLDTAQIRELVFREAVQDAILARKNGDLPRALVYLAGLYEAMRICWTRAERQLQGEDPNYENVLPLLLSTPAGATFRQYPKLYSEPSSWHEGHGPTAESSMGFDPAALMRIRRLVALAEQILAGSKNTEAEVRPEDIDFLLQTVPRQLVLLERHNPDIFQVLAPS
jgi:predicted MPP superfamily phosphohydrolase